MLVVLAALVVWCGRHFLPSDQSRIHRLIVRLLNSAAIHPNQSTFARLAAANRVADFFIPDAEIQLDGLGPDVMSIHSRGELVQAALAAQSRLRSAEFELTDFQVSFPSDKRTARAYLFITGKTNVDTNGFAHPFRMSLVRTNGQWLISSLAAAQRLE